MWRKQACHSLLNKIGKVCPPGSPGLLWQHRCWAPPQGWGPLLWTLWRVWRCPGSLFKGVLAPLSDFGILETECVIVIVSYSKISLSLMGVGWTSAASLALSMKWAPLEQFLGVDGEWGGLCCGSSFSTRKMPWSHWGLRMTVDLTFQSLWTFLYWLLSCLSPFPCSWQSVRKREKAAQELHPGCLQIP